MTQTTIDTSFFTVAQERSSVRQYDPSFKMDQSEIREILEIAIQAPSSSNLQPWRFLVIEDQAAKEELLPIANNQQQVVDASAVIAVLSDVKAHKNAERIYNEIVKNGNMTEEVKNAYVGRLVSFYDSASPERMSKMAMTDGGIVSQQLMLAAKAKGYDTVPMGGYDAEKFVKAFNVPENFEPVMLIAIGKGTKPGFKKNRLPLDEVLTWNKY